MYIYAGCDRHTSHFLKCHLHGGSEHGQVVMVAQSSERLSIFFMLGAV